MTARVLIVKNIEREGPGLFRDVLMKHRLDADVVDLSRGGTLPDVTHYGAMVVLGGPASANDDDETMRMESACVERALANSIPFLGVCLGHQILAKVSGSTISRLAEKEVGFSDASGHAHSVALTDAGREDPLFAGIESGFPVFHLHGETVQAAEGVEVLAVSNETQVQAIRVGRNAYGLQMHVEVVPEMLAVWIAQDEDLESYAFSELQRQFAIISDLYLATGRRLFENFLAIADLTSSIDLTESEKFHVR